MMCVLAVCSHFLGNQTETKYLYFSGEVDSPKFSFPERFSNLEVLQGPLPLVVICFLLLRSRIHVFIMVESEMGGENNLNRRFGFVKEKFEKFLVFGFENS